MLTVDCGRCRTKSRKISVVDAAHRRTSRVVWIGRHITWAGPWIPYKVPRSRALLRDSPYRSDACTEVVTREHSPLQNAPTCEMQDWPWRRQSPSTGHVRVPFRLDLHPLASGVQARWSFALLSGKENGLVSQRLTDDLRLRAVLHVYTVHFAGDTFQVPVVLASR